MEYRNYIIEGGGLGVVYRHKDYEGASFTGWGAEREVECADHRCGSAYTIAEAKEQIDMIIDEDGYQAIISDQYEGNSFAKGRVER